MKKNNHCQLLRRSITTHIIILFIVCISTSLNTHATTKEKQLPTIHNDNNGLKEIVFDTSMGSFTVAVDEKRAPVTAKNFLRYVDNQFYNDTLFHRVIPNFMAQAGGYIKGMTKKPTMENIINESANGLNNIRGTIAMARSQAPNTANSQFFINVVNNTHLDAKDRIPGYTVFGKVIEGMDVVDKISSATTKTSGLYRNLPEEDIIILSAKRKNSSISLTNESTERYLPGIHYTILDQPIPTRNKDKIEVIEAFSYGCGHCYAFDSLFTTWSQSQSSDVDYWRLSGIWNDSMAFYAQVFYTAQKLDVLDKTHTSLFKSLLVEQKKLTTEDDMSTWFEEHDVNPTLFRQAFHSFLVKNKVLQAKSKTLSYKLGSVPQIVINGKYRIDSARAGGHQQMLAIANYLIHKERAIHTQAKKQS